MKISYSWLKDYIKVDLDPMEVSEILTNTGLEVEGMEQFETVKGGLEGIVVGEVISVRKHPNADKLTLAEVNLGNGKIAAIVCGAPNVKEGQKVPVATIGSTLYKGEESFVIKKTKIRGETSGGMICAEDELGLGDSHDGIMVLDPKTPAGTMAHSYFNIQEDTIFEIGLTPNRIDGASHFGVARDLAAYLNQFKTIKANLPRIEDFEVNNQDLIIPVEVKNEKACPRYSGLTISGLKVGPSPEWLQNRLKSIGLSPINNVVDISNYVLHETGQPLHAFDAEQIKGNKIIVKTLKQGSKFISLDGEERKLSGQDLMICDEKDGMCIGGVLGGIKSGVTEKTNAIFLESACFDPIYIRKTARRHVLNTDASFRFERGADPEMTIYALKRAALLIKEIAGGKISSPIQDVYPKPFTPQKVELSFANLNLLIGIEIPVKKVKNILSSLDFKIIKESAHSLQLSVPLYRVDVTREADVIEEVLRIFGYNQIPPDKQGSSSINHLVKPDKEKIVNQLSDLLVANGFHEIMSNSLTKASYYEDNNAFDAKKSVKLQNPLSTDLNVMRQSLLFGGLEAIIYNTNRKRANLKFFEFGNSYQFLPSASGQDKLKKYHEQEKLALFITGNKNNESWNSKVQKVDFYTLKGIMQLLFQRLGVTDNELKISTMVSKIFTEGEKYTYQGKEFVQLGSISKNTLAPFEIEQDVFFADIQFDTLIQIISNKQIKFKALPRYPEVKRDLALLLDEGIEFEQIKELAFKTENKILRKVQIFDVFRGKKLEKGKKSYAVSFILQDYEKTLTDKRIEGIMNRLIKVYTEKLGAQIR